MPERRRKPRLRIREILDPKDPALSAAHAMLRSEFQRAEMSRIGEWRSTLRERKERLWTDVAWHLLVAERAGKLLAAATGFYLGNLNTGIIGYIAVVPAARSFGLGPRMRAALRGRFETDARQTGAGGLEAIVGEVREDNPWLRTLVRRGAIALDFPYYQPALSPAKEPVPLVMYYQPLQRPRKVVAASVLRRLLYSMWRRAYRISRPMARREFRLMVRSLASRRTVGQRRLDP